METKINDKISVIIPVYKAESYLRKCLDSVVNQTYPNLEIIIVDDGSPDKCGQICDEYSQVDKRIIVVHKKNEGVSIARNIGIDLAGGKWIAFVDPDDWLELNYYEKLIEEMGAKDVDIFCSGGAFLEYQQWTQIGRRISKSYFYSRQGYEEKREVFLAKVIWSHIPSDDLAEGLLFDMPWNNLYCASFIRKNKLYFEPGLHPLEDTLLNFMIFDQARAVAGCPYIGYHYTKSNEMSSTKGFKPNAFQELCIFLKKIDDYRGVSLRTQNNLIDDAIAARAVAEFFRCLRSYYFNINVDKSKQVIAKELKMAKYDPRFRWTFCRRSNRYFYANTFLIKYTLLLPGVWPLRISFKMIEYVRMIKLEFHERSAQKVCE